jgi:hypothetical protein
MSCHVISNKQLHSLHSYLYVSPPFSIAIEIENSFTVIYIGDQVNNKTCISDGCCVLTDVFDEIVLA